MADINKIQEEIAQDEKPTAITINQKNGEPYLAPDGSPCTVDVLGSDAKRVQLARDANQRRLLRSRRTKLEPADIREGRIEEAAAAVTGWTGWTAGESPFPYSHENAKVFLSAEHILLQVEAGIAGHSDFFSNALSS